MTLSIHTEAVCLGPLGGVSVESVTGLVRAPSSTLHEALLGVSGDRLWRPVVVVSAGYVGPGTVELR